jgi:hypothetical protein
MKHIIEKYQFAKHVWGETDCITFVASYLDSVAGTNYLEQYGSRWGSAKEAIAYAREATTSVELEVTKHCEKVVWGREQDGDLYVLDSEFAKGIEHIGAGIVYGKRLFHFGLDGLCATPLSMIPEPRGVYRCHK